MASAKEPLAGSVPPVSIALGTGRPTESDLRRLVADDLLYIPRTAHRRARFAQDSRTVCHRPAGCTKTAGLLVQV